MNPIYHLAMRKENLLRIAREHPLHPSLYEAQHQPQLVLSLLADAYGINDRPRQERLKGLASLRRMPAERRYATAARLLKKAAGTQQRELDALVQASTRGDERGRKRLLAGIQEDAVFDGERHALLIYAITTENSFLYALEPAVGALMPQELLDREIERFKRRDVLVSAYDGSPWAL